MLCYFSGGGGWGGSEIYTLLTKHPHPSGNIDADTLLFHRGLFARVPYLLISNKARGQKRC